MADIVLDREVLSKVRIPLSKTYTAPRGAPTVTHFDPAIFHLRYFSACMDCTFCHDSCCQHGCDADLQNIAQLRTQYAEPLEAFTHTSRGDWFVDETIYDPDFLGSRYQGTKVVNGTCIFRNPQGRGCGIHSYALQQGLDYHKIKPVLCWLFPLTVESRALVPQNVVLDKSLICVDRGITLYQSQRGEVGHLFGPELVAELDTHERAALAIPQPAPV